MIKKSTVFILGAGASIPYGYPSGETLVTETVNELLSQGTLFEICRKLDFTEQQIINFAKALSRSGDKSIDAFLERNSAFIKLGKVVITLKLIEKEDEKYLFSPGDDKWYGDLVNELKSSSVDGFDNNVSFLTFNYDRSFDHYLFVSIKNSYEELKYDKQCAEIVNNIPIIHLHGQIGKLPWQANEGIGRQYSNSFKEIEVIKRILSVNEAYYSRDELTEARSYILKVSEQIKIIYEKELDRDSGFQDAKNLLDKSNNIYFLGFGYHDDNLRRLNISEISPSIKRNIDGTSYGLGAAKRKHVKFVSNGKISLSDKNYKVVEFLKERVDFE